MAAKPPTEISALFLTIRNCPLATASDGRGNYTFGLTEQVVFPEIEQDKVDRPRGMDITFVTTAKNDDEGRALLKALGFPFKEA